jgi:nucleoside diphosphate kinase
MYVPAHASGLIRAAPVLHVHPRCTSAAQALHKRCGCIVTPAFLALARIQIEMHRCAYAAHVNVSLFMAMVMVMAMGMVLVMVMAMGTVTLTQMMYMHGSAEPGLRT